jgi:hypothetical protein
VARLREEALNEKAARELFAMQETSAERRKDAVVDKVMTGAVLGAITRVYAFAAD